MNFKWIWNHAKHALPLLFIRGKTDKQALVAAEIALWLPNLKLAEQSPHIPPGDGTKEWPRSWHCPSWDCRATQKLAFVSALLLLLLLSLQEKVSIQGSKEGGTGEPPAAFQWPGWSCTHTQQWCYRAHRLKKREKNFQRSVTTPRDNQVTGKGEQRSRHTATSFSHLQRSCWSAISLAFSSLRHTVQTFFTFFFCLLFLKLYVKFPLCLEV